MTLRLKFQGGVVVIALERLDPLCIVAPAGLGKRFRHITSDGSCILSSGPLGH